MSLFSRKGIAVATAEFVGTAMLTVVVIMSAVHSYIPYPFFIAAAAAVVTAMSMMAFGSISGANLNPVITLGMWTVRRTSSLKAVVYIAAQFLGAVAGNRLYTYLVGQSLPSSSHTFIARAMVAEAVGAFVFSLGFAAAVFHKLEGPKAAGVVGFSVFLGMLIASAGSNGLINPALALGLNSWIWLTYILGPVLGAVIGFNLYSLLFAPESSLIERPVAAKATARSSKK